MFFKKIGRFIKRFSSLLIVILAALVCAGTITAGILYIRSMTHSLWTQIVSDVTEITVQGAHSFETFLQKECESIEVLAQDLSYFDYSNPEERSNALKLFNMYSIEKGYFFMVVYDAPGGDAKKCSSYIAKNDPDDHNGNNVATVENTADYEKEYKEEDGIVGPFYNRTTGEKSLGYFHTFTFKDGTKAIVRKAQVLTDISNNFSLSFYEDTGFSYITKNDGKIILRSDNINSNRTSENIFAFLGKGDRSEIEMEKLGAAMTDGKCGAMLSTAGDEDRVLAFTPISGTDSWYMISVIPDQAISGNVENIIKSSLALTLVIVVVVVLFILFGLMMFFFKKRMVKKDAEVKYREQLFGILANNTDDVFIMTPHGMQEAEYISPNITRVLGVNESEVKHNLHAIGKPQNVESVEDYRGLAAVQELKDGETVFFDSVRPHKITGEQRYFHEAVYRASIDGVDKDIIVFSDRTAEKLAEAKLTEAMQAAQAASHAKSSFLSSMSHDIRTPMNAIVGMTSIATKHIDDKERVKDCLNKITMSSNHLLTLINDVLDISKIESGKLTLSPVVFSLRDTVTNLVNIVRPQITEKNLTFDVHVHNVEYEQLFADVLRVNQIFINILSNAVKYTPKGGKITMDLTQEVVEKDKRVKLTYVVSDNGIGMSEEYMKTMYETFSRAKDSRINTVQGTGLGLAIVKQMVTLMNGTIDCVSQLEKGTTFTIVLELPVADTKAQPLKLPPLNILIVDDDDMFLESVQDTMTELGAEVDLARSGEEALTKVKERASEYSVVIVDWKMPGMSGIETIKAIRKVIPKHTPVILVSAYDWEDIESEAKLSGVDGFISKPVFRSYIYEKLCSVLHIGEEKGKQQEESQNDLSGLKLLVAEDNDLNWEVISTLLEIYGISTSRAENGKKCVEMVSAAPKGTYDLILMDVQMPVMDGREATREIRKSGKAYVKNIPIIAMTADAFAEDIAACLEAGMNGHLAKPVDMDKLCQEVRRILFGKSSK